MKRLVSTALLFAAAGCSQPYEPAPRIATPHAPGGVFDSHQDDALYGTVSYSVLRSTLTDILGVSVTGMACAFDQNGDGDTTDPGDLLSPCPLTDPVGFLDASKELLGEPVYGEPGSSQAPGDMTSGGYKAWTFAAASACGIMAASGNAERLFPGAPDDYVFAYSILLGRLPRNDERARLDALRGQLWTVEDQVPSELVGTPVFPTLERQNAAVCTTLLTSLEFIGDV